MIRMVICILCLAFSGLDAQEALSPRIASYKIDLELDVVNKLIEANQILTWKNTGSTAVDELQFHLYYNAFKNSESTFFSGDREFPDFLENDDDESCVWAWSKVNSIIDPSGNQLIDNANYISNDDGNANDQTVLRVPLIEPIQPGASVSFEMQWDAKVPNVMPRTGYQKEFYHFAQWFPKLGVYETKGVRYALEDQWNCHQYHASGEYYSDFGNYEVSITLPQDYIVGSSGVLTNKTEKEGKNTWTYKVDDVIDFAWSCSPHFVVHEDKWKDVDIKLYTYKDHSDCFESYFESIKNAFSYLDEYVGEYPYPSLTIINTPIHGIFTGGMEYPTLITSLSFCFLPSGFRSTETLTTHEFIHQYFMQMVATHEQEEPWMDEGITTYYEGRILDHFYGKDKSLVDAYGIHIGNSEYNRAEFLSSGNTKIASNAIKAREYIHGGYGDIAYNKTAVWLKTLEGLIGRDCFDKIMKSYFEQWKFKHPSGKDFTNLVSQIVVEEHGDKFGADMDWFFDQVLYGTNECDYAVRKIQNKNLENQLGYFEDYDDCAELPGSKNKYLSKVILERKGEVILPIEVLVNFEDGTKKLEFWNGQKRSIDFQYETNTKIISVEIDPERKNYFDKNFINNSKTLKPDTSGVNYYFKQFMTGIQSVMQALTVLI